jgi:hypothetical protein
VKLCCHSSAPCLNLKRDLIRVLHAHSSPTIRGLKMELSLRICLITAALSIDRSGAWVHVSTEYPLAWLPRPKILQTRSAQLAIRSDNCRVLPLPIQCKQKRPRYPNIIQSQAISETTHDDYSSRFGGLTPLYGGNALNIMKEMHVCVIGVGGVGSWAVEALARSGVGSITLIDMDEVCISNTNR